MSTTDFVHLHPTGMNVCTLEKSAYAEALETWLCTGCGAPKPSVGAVDVQIQEERPANEPITFVNGCGIVLVRRDFLQLLGAAHVKADLLLGEVSGPSGKGISDWVTVRGRQRVIVRGSSNVSYRCCESCGRHVYFAMGARYLFPAPTGSVSIYESDLYGLVVASSVLEGISLSNWPKVGVESLKVLPKPKDSLGELP
jgi:hypothetical protein